MKKSPGDSRRLFEAEKGSYLKKWTGRFPVGLIYSNRYKVGMSSLGFQLVYSLLNEHEHLVCERFFLPEPGEPLRSVESGRTLDHFPLLFYSISFEDDYLNLLRILLMGGVELVAEKRGPQVNASTPLVIGGGVATFVNPETLAPFTDCFVIGEAEPVLGDLVKLLIQSAGHLTRNETKQKIVEEVPGCYVPSHYQPHYDGNGHLISMQSIAERPGRVKRVSMNQCREASHSQLLTPHAEFSDLYLTELGRGCSRGCRFCAAGFIYRPPRLWSSDAVIKGLEQRQETTKRVGLLGMEMADRESLASLSRYLQASGCSLSFSSLRADRISGNLLDLLRESGLKSVAIAADGASERLRRVINKGLTEEEILAACRHLAETGLYKLKIYLMIGLPSEEREDLDEMLDLIKKVKKVMNPIGREKGRLCQIALSVNCFVPKPWTPFQYHCFGVSEYLQVGEVRSVKDSIKNLKEKLSYLRKGLAGEANVRMRCDKPEKVVFQAILAKGDRRLAEALINMTKKQWNWKKALKKSNLTAEQFITTGSDNSTFFPWYIIDHGIDPSYLHREYLRSFKELTTKPCNTKICRSCGVCREK